MFSCEMRRISVQHRLAIDTIDLVRSMKLEVTRLLVDSSVLVYDDRLRRHSCQQVLCQGQPLNVLQSPSTFHPAPSRILPGGFSPSGFTVPELCVKESTMMPTTRKCKLITPMQILSKSGSLGMLLKRGMVSLRIFIIAVTVRSASFRGQ